MRQLYISLVAGAFAAATLLAGSAYADDIKLPRSMAWTAYGVGSGGYTQVVAIGNVLQNKYGTSVRILPGETDIARMTPLKTGRVDLCACGIASYYGSEGVMLFARPDWGPQPIRVIITSIGRFGLGVAVAGDAGVKTPADLKGKRVAYIRGDDALNLGTEAFLAFGNLTWDDVKRITFPGYGRSFDGIIGNQADAAFTMSVTPAAQQLDASPRGITWPELDPNDKEGWERLLAIAPYFQPHQVTAGAGISEDKPWQGASYPYPIVVANADYDEETAYNLIKALIENYDEYKDAAPGNEGFALEMQNMQWVIPFHDSVIRYYQEAGVWNDELQAHQDRLVKRQELLAETWQEFLASNPPSAEEAFEKAWMETRAEALEEAGMIPVFR